MKQIAITATLLAHVVQTNFISPSAVLIEYFNANGRVRPFDAAVLYIKGTPVKWPVPVAFLII